MQTNTRTRHTRLDFPTRPNVHRHEVHECFWDRWIVHGVVPSSEFSFAMSLFDCHHKKIPTLEREIPNIEVPTYSLST